MQNATKKQDCHSPQDQQEQSLYEAQQSIHPKAVKGFFRRLKNIIMIITLGIYYCMPWIRWDRPGIAPDQAILIDFPHNRFYFFFIEIWSQEVYYITGLLIVGALALFLMTAMAGRIWCGYLCLQTVWTDLYIAVERWIEGDRNQRIKLDALPFSLNKLTKKLAKHSLWFMIAIATGGAFVFYFRDAPTLLLELLNFSAPLYAVIFLGIFTFTTYLLAGFAREQVCTHMCPWPRIQSALVDDETLLITYHDKRGEPRASLKSQIEQKGDCIDCNLCVAVCPQGIDIRDGFQLACIQCALCIDACDGVMEKLNRPKGLINYDFPKSILAMGEKPKLRLFRARVIVYIIGLALVAGIMLTAFLNRSDAGITALRDRNPLFIKLSSGQIRNTFTLKISNKSSLQRNFILSENLKGKTTLYLMGQKSDDKKIHLTVDPDQVVSYRIFVERKRDPDAETQHVFSFILKDKKTGIKWQAESVFIEP